MALVAIYQAQQVPKPLLSTSPCRCCRVAANYSRLSCKTGCSTDARLSNVVHCIVSLQFAIQLRFSSFLQHVVAPTSCLGPFDPLPWSLGLSSSLRSGGCFFCALLCAVQGHMSACRTEPAANPGGRQGAAQTGRRWGGGWTEAEPPALRNHMLRGFPRYPARTFYGSWNGHTETLTHGRPEFRMND